MLGFEPRGTYFERYHGCIRVVLMRTTSPVPRSRKAQPRQSRPVQEPQHTLARTDFGELGFPLARSPWFHVRRERAAVIHRGYAKAIRGSESGLSRSGPTHVRGALV